jgi:hypothetical protein
MNEPLLSVNGAPSFPSAANGGAKEKSYLWSKLQAVYKESAIESKSADVDIEGHSDPTIYYATDDSIEKAAMYIMDAWDGRSTAHDTSHNSFKTYKFLNRSWWKTFYNVISLVFSFQIFIPEEFGIAAPGWQTIHQGLEVGVILTVGLDIMLMRKLHLSSTSDSDKTNEISDMVWIKLRASLLFITAVDFAVSVVTARRFVRFSTFSRLFFLVFRNFKLRTAFVGCLVAGTQISKVLLLISCDVIFFGFVGFVLFGKIDSAKNFDTPLNGMRTMLLVLTAPGSMLGDLAHLFAASDGLASYYFVTFMVITTMIFQKLVLATAYRSYKAYQKQQYLKVLHNYKAAARKAFSLIAPFGNLNRAVWHKVFAKLKGTHHPLVAGALFDAIDEDYSFIPGNGYIEFEPFSKLCEISKHTGNTVKHLELHEPHELTNLERVQKSFRHALRYKFYVCGVSGFQTSTGVGFTPSHMLADIFVVASVYQLYMSVKFPEDQAWSIAGLLILIAFTLEAALKIFAYGWKRYISVAEHNLDFFCVSAGILILLYERLFGSKNADIYNMALTIRTLRILKFLWLSETLHGLLETILRLGKSLLQLFFILFVPLYIFSVISCQLFHESMNEENASKAADTPWYPFRSELNFGTYPNSLLTLFSVSTLASWNMVMIATDKMVGVGTFWVETYFFSFRIIMTMMFVPILTGYLIENFVTNFDTYEKHKHESKNLSDPSSSEEMELRLLKAPKTTRESVSSRARGKTIVDPTVHKKNELVKKLLRKKTVAIEVEKKIFGVGEVVKNQLLGHFRETKARLENEIRTKVNQLQNSNYKIQQLKEDNKMYIQQIKKERREHSKEILDYEIKPLLVEPPPPPPPPPSLPINSAGLESHEKQLSPLDETMV